LRFAQLSYRFEAALKSLIGSRDLRAKRAGTGVNQAEPTVQVECRGNCKVSFYCDDQLTLTEPGESERIVSSNCLKSTEEIFFPSDSRLRRSMCGDGSASPKVPPY
jgi:hypothetical protein